MYNYLKTNFAVVKSNYWSLTELDNMIPWEREAYLTLLMQFIEEEKQARENS
jgi:hypothetical protein